LVKDKDEAVDVRIFKDSDWSFSRKESTHDEKPSSYYGPLSGDKSRGQSDSYFREIFHGIDRKFEITYEGNASSAINSTDLDLPNLAVINNVETGNSGSMGALTFFNVVLDRGEQGKYTNAAKSIMKIDDSVKPDLKAANIQFKTISSKEYK
jgi:hypothetical protein